LIDFTPEYGANGGARDNPELRPMLLRQDAYKQESLIVVDMCIKYVLLVDCIIDITLKNGIAGRDFCGSVHCGIPQHCGRNRDIYRCAKRMSNRRLHRVVGVRPKPPIAVHCARIQRCI